MGVLIFSLLLAFWAFNAYHVLYRLEKYRHMPMLCFYIMSLILIIANLCEYSLQYVVLFPDYKVIVCVELKNVSYIAVGICL